MKDFSSKPWENNKINQFPRRKAGGNSTIFAFFSFIGEAFSVTSFLERIFQGGLVLNVQFFEKSRCPLVQNLEK